MKTCLEKHNRLKRCSADFPRMTPSHCRFHPFLATISHAFGSMELVDSSRTALTVTVKTNQQTKTNNLWSHTHVLHVFTSDEQVSHLDCTGPCLWYVCHNTIFILRLSFKVCRCQMKMRLTGRSLFVDLLFIVSTVLVISKLFPTHGVIMVLPSKQHSEISQVFNE